MNGIGILRCFLLAFSFYGYSRTLRKKLCAEISIALVMASIGTLMFIAGIFGILRASAVAICGCGCALAVWSIVRRDNPKDMLTVGTLVFLAFCVYFAVILYGMEFSEYDNFTHWAIAPKLLIEKNRFPNFLDVNIEYQSYPLGSAAYIYYFVRITGITAEWMQMYAQAVLIFSMVVTMFALVRKRGGYILALVSSVILVAGNTNLTELLVDTLLPMVAIAGMSACICAGEKLKDNLWVTIPFNLFLISIKNSGIFFVLAILCYVFLRARRDIRNNIWKWAITVCLPFALLFLWQEHVKVSFSDGMTARHTMSVAYYLEGLKYKNINDIQAIAGEMVKWLLSPQNITLYLLAFLLILICALRFIPHKGNYKDRYLTALTLIYMGAYIVGLFGMYVFSMPVSEAVRLAGIYRYYSTIMIFTAGMVTMRVILLINSVTRSAVSKICICSLAVLCGIATFFSVSPNLQYYSRGTVDSVRLSFDRLIKEYNIPQGGNYIVVHSSMDTGYLRHLTRYLLNPNRVVDVDGNWFEENPDKWREFDYLIVAEQTEEFEDYLSRNFGNREVIDLAQYK